MCVKCIQCLSKSYLKFVFDILIWNFGYLMFVGLYMKGLIKYLELWMIVVSECSVHMSGSCAVFCYVL